MDKLKQPSTWAGLAAILATLAPIAAPFSPELSWGLSGLAALFGGAAVRINEYPGKK